MVLQYSMHVKQVAYSIKNVKFFKFWDYSYNMVFYNTIIW